MKSIKTKIMAFMFACVLVSTAVVGGAGIIHAGNVVDEDSANIMSLLCKGKTQELNALLSRIEQSVQTVSDYAVTQLEGTEQFWTDPAYIDGFTDKIESVLLNAANHTEGALAVYIRYNPEFADPVSGLFCSRDSQESNFKKLIPTDFSRFSPTDVEHVGWYYIPVSNGKPTWIAPYMNKNINVEMISYVIPLYTGDALVGVVGMDIDFLVVKDIVDDMRVYKSGYAFLTDGKSIVYHKNYLMGTPLAEIGSGTQGLAARLENQPGVESLVQYHLDGQDKRAVIGGLNNGMKLVLAVPSREINATRNMLAFQIAAEAVLIIAATLVLTFLITRRMSRPLCELNEAAQKIAEGDMSVTINCRSKDEIGMLAESFRKTAKQLNHYIGYIKGLAYRDPMTGVKSKTAYLEAVEKLDNSIQIGRPEFGVVVLDINGLKRINDVYGHDFGDMQIIAASQTICKVFKRSPVYRIGGDEFVAILENTDLENYGALLDDFKKAMEDYNKHVREELKLLIARGIAIYSSDTDVAYADVFKRADTAMYHNKKRMKEQQEEL